jgi:hypothetical protein
MMVCILAPNTPVSATSKFICKNHPRQVQVETFQEYVPARRHYDSTMDRQDAQVHFQKCQFEAEKTKHDEQAYEFLPKRFHIVLPRCDETGIPITPALNAQMDFDVSLPDGWFDSYPAGDPRHLPDPNKLRLADKSEWSKQAQKSEREARAETSNFNFKTWVSENLPPDEQPDPDAYKLFFGVARPFKPEREFGTKDSMLFYAVPSLVDLPENEFLKACAERRKLNRATRRLLREIGFFSLGESVYIGPIDPRDTCPRCGCQFYTRNENGKLRCHDCHLHLPESERKSEAEESDVVERGERAIERNLSKYKIYDPNAGRWLRSLTAEQFVNGLIKLGRFRRLHLGANIKKAAGSYQILVDGLLPRDVAQQTGEKPTTIKSRADDVFDAAANDEELEVTAEDVVALKLLKEKYLPLNPSWDSYLVREGD